LGIFWGIFLLTCNIKSSFCLDLQHIYDILRVFVYGMQRDLQLLDTWCQKYEQLNPGSYAKVWRDDQDRFDYVLVCPSVMLLRAVVGGIDLSETDCAFMKHRFFKGQMMVWIGLDGNNKLIPMALKLCPQVCEKPVCVCARHG